ncbi:MAG: hypothetical protein EPN43_11420 [Jatrophihabitans sp.]|nr:MAG: hypothetical protein EPN43_11420 [Jatrophihabitans sp.]
MDLPGPQVALAALAQFVRARLAEVGGSLGPLLGRGGDGQAAPQRRAELARTAIVAAAAPFAATSYARARLLRQLYASGLLTDHEAERAIESLHRAS